MRFASKRGLPLLLLPRIPGSSHPRLKAHGPHYTPHHRPLGTPAPQALHPTQNVPQTPPLREARTPSPTRPRGRGPSRSGFSPRHQRQKGPRSWGLGRRKCTAPQGQRPRGMGSRASLSPNRPPNRQLQPRITAPNQFASPHRIAAPATVPAPLQVIPGHNPMLRPTSFTRGNPPPAPHSLPRTIRDTPCQRRRSCPPCCSPR